MGDEDFFEQSKNMVFLIVVIPLIFICVILTITLFSRFTEKSFDVPEIRYNQLMESLRSEKCFAFNDGSVRSEVVDITKFNSERLGKCVDIGGRDIGIKASLEYDGKKKEAVVNELMVNREFLCKGGNVCSERRDYVLVNDNGLKGGILDILIIELRD